MSAELGQVGNSRGHIYLTLIEKDENGEQIVAQVEAVLWKSQHLKLQKKHGLTINQLWQSGLEVKLRVTVDYHDRYGFKLVVEDADPIHTVGKLEQQRQLVLESLRAQGYLELNPKQPLALVPQKIAVISSASAAGYADFKEQLLRNEQHYYYELTLFPAAMQGPTAPAEIMRCLRRIKDQCTQFDAVVIIRGGGARMDLLAFDDQSLCIAVAEMPLPVIVGIGHETDEVLLDRVAHTSLKTPTAVAAFLLDLSERLESNVLGLAFEIQRYARQGLSQEKNVLLQHKANIVMAVNTNVQAQAYRLREATSLLPQLVRGQFHAAKQQLNQMEELLTALRPETTLARGYALLSQEGKLVSTTQAYNPEKELEIRLQDGNLKIAPNAE